MSGIRSLRPIDRWEGDEYIIEIERRQRFADQKVTLKGPWLVSTVPQVIGMQPSQAL
jgi:hypothetical protein